MERVRGAHTDDYRELHRWMQHDPPSESRGAVPESAAGNPRGGPRPHRTHDCEPGPEIRHDREFRRADAVPHRRPPPATPLPDVPHGEARARRHLGGCEGEHRGGWPHGTRSRLAVMVRLGTAATRGPNKPQTRRDRSGAAAESVPRSVVPKPSGPPGAMDRFKCTLRPLKHGAKY